MMLPNADRAELGEKIETYCLDFDHADGKHKALLFRNKIGIVLENREILKTALLDAARCESAIIKKMNEHGVHYQMKFRLTTQAGSSLILAGWIVRAGEDFPRLTTAYPVEK